MSPKVIAKLMKVRGDIIITVGGLCLLIYTGLIPKKRPTKIDSQEYHGPIGSLCEELWPLVEPYDDLAAEAMDRCRILIYSSEHLIEKVPRSRDPDKELLLTYDLDKLRLAGHLQELLGLVYSRLIGHYGTGGSPSRLLLAILDEPVLTGLRNLTAWLEHSAYESNIKEKRLSMAEKLDKDMKAHLERLQNEDPYHKTLVCSSETLYGGGFSFFVNVVTWCLAAAVASDRSMVYHKPEGFLMKNEFVLNISQRLEKRTFQELQQAMPLWPSDAVPSDYELMDLFRIYNAHLNRFLLSQDQYQLPPHIPYRLDPLDHLYLISEQPLAWYVGQLTQYLIRPAPGIVADHQERARYYGVQLGHRGPLKDKKVITAAIHVRRGNKITERESPAQPLWKYMVLVEDWYRKMEYKLEKRLERRLFVFSDDFSVLGELYQNYPEYSVLCNSTVIEYSKGPADDPYNYQQQNVDMERAILLDMLLMVEMDFIVSTYTSNVPRVVHALRNARDPITGPKTLVSLDLDWYFEKMLHSYHYVAIQDHHPAGDDPSDLHFNAGDEIHLTHRFRLNKEPWAWDYLEQRFPDGITVGVNMKDLENNNNGRKRARIGKVPRYKLRLLEKDLKE